MAVPAQAFRNGMARLSAAVHVVTTDGPAGRAGLTMSSVCPVTDSPATLLICVNRQASLHPVLSANRVFCVNTLEADQQGVSARFAGGLPPPERFLGAEWTTLATGAPVLLGALVAFDCRLVDCHEVGTHSVFYAEVEAIAGPLEGQSLVWLDRGYRRVASAA